MFLSASDTMKKEYNQTTQELLFLNEIRIIWSGDQITHKKKKIYASELALKNKKSLKGSENKPLTLLIPEHSDLNSRFWIPPNQDDCIENHNGIKHDNMRVYNSDTRAVGQFLKIVGDLLDVDMDTYLSDSMTTQEIYKEEEVDHVKIDTIDSKAAVTVTLAAKCLELQLVVETLLKSCSSSTPHTTSSVSSSSSSTITTAAAPSISPHSGQQTHTKEKEKEKEENPFSLPLSTSMKSWISLLTAKAILCSIGNHQMAYNWVRRSLSYASPRSVPDTLKTTSNSGGCLSVDRCHPRIEVRLPLLWHIKVHFPSRGFQGVTFMVILGSPEACIHFPDNLIDFNSKT